ncbi:inverse autotransporter beta domain-containing protein [Enterobacter sp. 22466]|uniref:inverse autotransporter beta domain-containing protein n=1 Tax=Enterobacter sp. 22466 TaxID=3453924 RepID=UPI003F844399
MLSNGTLQRNPQAMTLGLTYTPVPMVGFALEHTQGQSGNNDVAKVALNYRVGIPWEQQLDPDAVRITRTLSGSRNDLVDRNNDIVLEYRKQQVIHLTLPPSITGKEGQSIPLNYQVNARHGLQRID